MSSMQENIEKILGAKEGLQTRKILALFRHKLSLMVGSKTVLRYKPKKATSKDPKKKERAKWLNFVTCFITGLLTVCNVVVTAFSDIWKKYKNYKFYSKILNNFIIIYI